MSSCRHGDAEDVTRGENYLNHSDLKILMIEDNPRDVRLIKEMLMDVNSARTELVHAGCLREGLVKLRSENFDVLLLDLGLPDSDGLDTLRHLLREDADIPIIVMTGQDSEELSLQAVHMGAQDYLVKGQVTPLLLVRSAHYAVERKYSEKILKEVNKKLTKLDRLKSDFLATVSHELRTPLAVMKEGVSLCLDGVLGEVTDDQCDVLTDTLRHACRLEHLVTDLLDISKIEAGRIELHRSMIDISKIARNVGRDYKRLADKKGIIINIAVPENPVKLYADVDKVVQVFGNLVSNALRFTDSGGRVEIRVADDEEDVVCSVSDTGVGISKDDLPRLFSKFQQIGRINGPGYRGTGLGLAIVKGLVERHGGTIGVESEQGKGSTFCFTLKKMSYPTILIVDDDPSLVDLMKKFLRDMDYFFLDAFCGEEAVEKALDGCPSLIILDMMLPGMSGYEVIGRLKQDTRTKDIPIIINSGYHVDEERLQQVDNYAAIPVLNKPVRPEVLQGKVREMIINTY